MQLTHLTEGKTMLATVAVDTPTRQGKPLAESPPRGLLSGEIRRTALIH